MIDVLTMSTSHDETPRPDDSRATRRSLLERLKHWSDQDSWQEFFNRYWRLIYSVALKSGLNDQEAQDVVQETVLSVARHIDGFVYDPGTCSFKTWMMRMTRWRILNQLRKRTRENETICYGLEDPFGNELLENLPDPAGPDLERIWEQEWQQHIYQTACEAVKQAVSPGQFQIYDMVVHEQWPSPKVARTLGISPARVYLAKHRVSRLIKKEVRRLERGDGGIPGP